MKNMKYAKIKIFGICLQGVPAAAKKSCFFGLGLKRGPPAAKNHDFSDWVIQGGPAAATNQVFLIFRLLLNAF